MPDSPAGVLMTPIPLWTALAAVAFSIAVCYFMWRGKTAAIEAAKDESPLSDLQNPVTDDQPLWGVLDAAPPNEAPNTALPLVMESEASPAVQDVTAPTVASALPETTIGGRVFLNVTPKFLVDLCTDPAKAASATAPYTGKWLEALLVVRSIRDYPPGNCVFVDGRAGDDPGGSSMFEGDWVTFTCTFDRSLWLSRLEGRRAGDALHVIGEVKDIDSQGIALGRAELKGSPRPGAA